MVGRTGFVGTRRARHFSLSVVSKHGRLAKDAQRERLEKCVFKPAGMKIFRQPFRPLPKVVAAYLVFKTPTIYSDVFLPQRHRIGFSPFQQTTPIKAATNITISTIIFVLLAG